MIRPATVFWIGLAGAVGFGLYQLKHEVHALEDQLFRVNRSILAEEEAIHVLHAEWSYVNQPSRLQSLTARHLDLQPTKPAQIGKIATLPTRGDAATPTSAEPPAALAPKVRITSVVATTPGGR
jgi:hypothetical protein